MKNIFVRAALAASFIGVTSYAQPTKFADARGLAESKACLLSLVRSRLHIQKPVDLAPALKVESETSLLEFQEAMETFWQFRPDVFVNVYDKTRNTIFLTNNLEKYKLPRQPMESLVHELTHFVQVHDLNGGSGDADLLEVEAVQVQEWFRENLAQNIVAGTYQGPCTSETK